MEIIRKLMKRYWDIIIYIFFGGLTTLVNFCVYFPMYNWLCWPAAVCNIIAWVISVVFAFLTNKPFVFHSTDWSRNVVIPELGKFVGCRIASGLFETALIWVLVDFLLFNGNVVKVLISIIVVAANYLGSKWFVFHKNK